MSLVDAYSRQVNCPYQTEITTGGCSRPQRSATRAADWTRSMLRFNNDCGARQDANLEPETDVSSK